MLGCIATTTSLRSSKRSDKNKRKKIARVLFDGLTVPAEHADVLSSLRYTGCFVIFGNGAFQEESNRIISKVVLVTKEIQLTQAGEGA